ncbi:neuroligin-4, Y-linked [Chrysoperla carnea]|uniref:neuroligin-4, Y-linked n=1 Tax=Chrysoperla carnea TaxID=189513 RepID=UPI001D095EB9|nr:neuroligin-4, Y-linked [Chrysoperla carnea]
MVYCDVIISDRNIAAGVVSAAGSSDSLGGSSAVVGSQSQSTGSAGNSGGGGGGGTPSILTSRTVRTKYGDVSGIIVSLDSRHLEPVEVFRGIPYAMPPTGNLRFMPPVTGALWSGVKLADKFSPVCPQRLPDIRNETAALKRMSRGRLEYLKRLLPYLQNQSEDCLYLNIYAPVQAGTREGGGSNNFRRYPVMVFIHGESYEWNSGNPYDGSVLASYGGVVVVTINYRLGVLGFLNANTDTYTRSPANYGLMDQIAALHWLQENIAVFGGDPTNVTIVGHGTGSACVNFLITSSAVPDGLLFHRAILMSGSAFSPWALVQEPARYAAQVAQHANCSPELPHSHLMKCLRERPLDVLLSTPVRAPDFAFAFGPSVDGVVIDTGEPSSQLQESQNYDQSNNVNKKELIPNAITTLNNVLLRKTAISKLTRYDLMLGIVKAEAYFAFNGEDVQYGIEADRRSKILRTFVRNTFSYHLSEILATIVNEYTDWERPVQHPINIRDETLEALSDAQYVAPVVQTADLHSAERRNSYLYVFDYQTKFGDYPQRQGCIHGEELPYIFGAPLVGGMSHFIRNYTKSEVLLAEATMIYWSNFARTGNPNEPQETESAHGRQERNRFKNIEWTAYEAVHKKYLNLDTKPRLKNHYRAHRLSFWLNLVPDLHRPGGDDVPNSHHALDEDDIIPTPKIPPLAPRKLSPTDLPAGGSNIDYTKTTLLGSSLGGILNLTGQHIVTTTTAESSINSGFETSDDTDFGLSTTQNSIEDGFAAYSTALSVVIAIGCSLLILNVLVFAGVYYQRDKSRLHHHEHNGNGGNPPGVIGSNTKKRNENGQIPNNICGDLETSIVTLKTDPATILSHHHSHHTHHQLPPPEFADLPQNNVTLPRHPPPPPKVTKPVGAHHVNTLTNQQHQQKQAENQPLLSAHSIQMINTGTLTKKNTQLNAKQMNSGSQQVGGNTMEELRV